MNILFVDIEATDLDADIGSLLCIGYKWAHEKTAKVLDKRDYPGKNLGDDTQLLEAFAPIQMKADMIVHHFGEYYDMPFLQTRRLINGLKPLPETAFVDTWRIARKKLKFKSNRLERILSVLGCPFKKTSLDILLWARARWGDKKSLDYIIQHCKMDILVLEWVYNKIKGVWTSHPNLYQPPKNQYSASTQQDHCKVCRNGYYRSDGLRPCKGKVYRRLYCPLCGHTDKGKVI